MSAILINRRRLLGAGLGALGLSALGTPARAARPGRLSVLWWGSDERTQRTRDAFAAFQRANDGVTIETNVVAWTDYWTKLSATVSAGKTPDLIQMESRYMADYAQRGVIMPLDPYVGKQLNIADFGSAYLESCSFDGKLYGVCLGVNAAGLAVDDAAWREAGIEAPTFGTTFAAYADKCKSFAKSNKQPKVYASFDGSGNENMFLGWLYGRGKALYTEAGKLAYDVADAVEWFKYWADLRAAGGCVPPDIQALYKDTLETSPLILGHTATDLLWSNQFVVYQHSFQRSLSLISVPVVKTGAPSCYLKPSMMFSVSAKTAELETTLELINFVAREPNGALHLGVERGVPASPELREALTMDLDKTDSTSVRFVDAVAPYVGAQPPLPPKAAGACYALLRRVSAEVATGALTPAKGGDKLVAECVAALAKA